MTQKEVVRLLRHGRLVVPGELRRARARLLLGDFPGFAVTEVTCPACDGRGFNGVRPLDGRCPLCRGFGAVPLALADWFWDRVGIENTPPPVRAHKGPHMVRKLGLETAYYQIGERLGIAAERQHRTDFKRLGA